MTVELEKNMMTGMLTVLGKLVNRNAADKSYLVLRLEAKDGVLKFSTHSATEQLTYQMAVQCAESLTGYAEFDAFRDAVRSCRAKNVQLSCDENVLTVSDTAVSLTEAVWPEEEKDFRGITCTLPENFLGMCARAAQVIDRTEVRPALRGINLNREGITATSGREMIHFPCPLKVESLTIPLPLALLQSKCEEAGTLQFWPENMGTSLRMTVGPWEWQTRALTGPFPAWQKVIPAEEVLIRSVEISTESTAQLIASLRSQPDPDDKLSVCLQQANKESLSIQMGNWSCTIPAVFTGKWGENIHAIGRKILLHLLTLEHTKIAFCESRQMPFVASGGMGRFIAMPMNTPTPSTRKENTVDIRHTQVVESSTAPATAPLDDLSLKIESFRGKLKDLFEESAVLLRKVKEATLLQKQKEREFVQARKAIERIRMAI